MESRGGRVGWVERSEAQHGACNSQNSQKRNFRNEQSFFKADIFLFGDCRWASCASPTNTACTNDGSRCSKSHGIRWRYWDMPKYFIRAGNLLKFGRI